MSIKYSYDELRKFIEDKIKELRKEIEYYEGILKVLDEVSKTPTRREEKRVKEEVITLKDSDGNIVTTIAVTPTRIRVMPLIKLRDDHPLIKSFLLKFLEEKKASSTAKVSRYDVKSANNNISEIVIEGNFNEYFIIELEAALMHIINSISKEGIGLNTTHNHF